MYHPTSVTVYAATAPFVLHGEAPRYHPSTDALCGSYNWVEKQTWNCPNAAERTAEKMEEDSDGEYRVHDAEGRRVVWPELGPEPLAEDVPF